MHTKKQKKKLDEKRTWSNLNSEGTLGDLAPAEEDIDGVKAGLDGVVLGEEGALLAHHGADGGTHLVTMTMGIQDGHIYGALSCVWRLLYNVIVITFNSIFSFEAILSIRHWKGI